MKITTRFEARNAVDNALDTVRTVQASMVRSETKVKASEAEVELLARIRADLATLATMMERNGL